MRRRLMQWAESLVGADWAGWVIPDQPVLSTIGGIIAVGVAAWWARRDGLVWWKTLLAGGAAAGLATVGARVLWAVTKYELVLADPSILIDPWRGGAVSFGALGGAALGALLAIKLLRAPVWRHCDVLFPPGLFGIALARVGCLMRACDYGIPSDLPWAVRYPQASNTWRRHFHEGLVESTEPLSLAVHPFPLYLAAWAVACGLLAMLKPDLFGRAPGQRAMGCCMVWLAGRFVFEFLRHPGNAPMVWGPINLGQLFALIGIAAIAVLHVILGRHHAANTAPAP